MSVVWGKKAGVYKSNMPPVGTTLNDCTWKQISAISREGLAPLYWAVGDCKAVILRGTVANITFDNTYYVYIIGFNHNGNKNTIDFGMFKTTDGTDVCLVDSKHGSNAEDGTILFNMNHSGNTNKGGWKDCDLRYDVLGSTKSKGSNAAADTATSPVPNTLMAALPSDLRAVMKPMTIYTDNTGNGEDTASNVTISIDYLPLLAEFELHGFRSLANSAEKNYQAQYDYYANGNSKAKYRHNATTTAAYWWVRSPYSTTTTNFCDVKPDGTRNAYGAKYSIGLSPIFRV